MLPAKVARTFYNDVDPRVTWWLRGLIDKGMISRGTVDERTIKDIKGSDLQGSTRVHLFAGIGGWELALRMAAWPEEVPVWTGSCPCQPFSAIGRRGGVDDERHLWPEFRRLIDECKPDYIFGEQVASPDGRAWLDRVQTDLEEMGYAVGPFDLCSASFGAPNIRQRLYFAACRMADPLVEGLERHAGHVAKFRESRRLYPEASRPAPEGCDTDFWGDAIEICCDDGKTRRVPPQRAFWPLAPRLPSEVAYTLLHGIGNAVNPIVASNFIRAFMDVLCEMSP